MPLSNDMLLRDILPAMDTLAADSLFMQHIAEKPTREPWTITYDATEIFGPDSFHPFTEITRPPAGYNITDNIPYQCLVLLAFVLFIFFMAVHRGQVMATFRLMGRAGSEARKNENHTGIRRGFLYGFVFTGMLLTGIAMARIFSIFSEEPGMERNSWLPAAGILAAILIQAGVALLQNAATSAIGGVTFTGEFTRKLNYARGLYYMGFTAVSGVFVLLASLTSGGWASAFSWVWATVAAIFLILYVYRTMALFMKQKVSILFWILYLCTVEAMPWCIIIVTVIRSIF